MSEQQVKSTCAPAPFLQQGIACHTRRSLNSGHRPWSRPDKRLMIDALPGHLADSILLVLTDLWMHRGDEPREPSKQVRELLSMGRMVPV